MTRREHYALGERVEFRNGRGQVVPGTVRGRGALDDPYVVVQPDEGYYPYVREVVEKSRVARPVRISER